MRLHTRLRKILAVFSPTKILGPREFPGKLCRLVRELFLSFRTRCDSHTALDTSKNIGGERGNSYGSDGGRRGTNTIYESYSIPVPSIIVEPYGGIP